MQELCLNLSDNISVFYIKDIVLNHKFNTLLEKKRHIGRILLQNGLKQRFGINIGLDCIIHDELGKPFIVDEHSNPISINVSLSHSFNITVCAIAKCKIGCDVEKVKPVKKNLEYILIEFEKILDYIPLYENEEEHYIVLWTMYEALGKLLGKGIPLSKEDIIYGKRCNFYSYHLNGEYLLTLCIEK